jgi:hypothetical protein
MPFPLIPILGMVARVAIPAIGRALAPKAVAKAVTTVAPKLAKQVAPAAVVHGAANMFSGSGNKSTTATTPGKPADRYDRSTPSTPKKPDFSRGSYSTKSTSSTNKTTNTNNTNNNNNKSNTGNASGTSTGATPSTTSSSSSGSSSGSSGSSTQPVKSAPIDTVIFQDEAFEAEFLVGALFEDIVGQELLTISRNDTVNGQEVAYSPIQNLGLLQQTYNPNNIIGLSETSFNIFSSFVIQLNDRIPTISSQNTTDNYYVDPENGGIIIELINMPSNEQVEFQVATSGTIEELGI